MGSARSRFTAAVAALALGGIFATQASALDLTEPVRITSRHEQPRASDIGIDARGRAYAAWTSHGTPRDDRGTIAHFSRLDARGRPVEPVDLGSAKRVFVALATAPDGTSVVVYANRRGGRPHLEMARFAPSGRPDRVRTLSRGEEAIDPFSVHVEATPDGGAFVSWSSVGVRVVRISPTGTVGPVQTVSVVPLSEEGYVTGADLSVNGRGEAALAWVEAGDFLPGEPQPPSRIQFARVSAEGVADEPETAVGADGSPKSGPPVVALADDGTANIAYTASYSALPYTPIFTSANFLIQVTSADEVTPPAVLTTPYYSPLVEMTMGGEGRATLALIDGGPGPRRATHKPATISIAPDGEIGPTVDLAQRVTDGGVPAFHLASDGTRTFASWAQRQPGDGRHTTVSVATLRPDGRPSGIQEIGSGYAAGLAASRRGPAALMKHYDTEQEPLFSVVPARR